MQSALDGAQVLDEGTAEDTFQNTSKRGRKRAVYQDHPETSLRRRTSARDVLPIDDEIHQYFPCPVAACKAVFHNRAERSFHIRTDHVGYKYKPGDGMDKMQNIEQVNYEEDDAILDVGSISEERKPLADDPLSDYSEEHEQRYQMALGQHKPPTWHGSHMMSGPSHHEPFIIDRISKKHGEIDTNTFSANTDLYRETDSGPKRRGRPKNPPGSEPGPTSKVRLPDPNGKYRCYIPDCPWKGGYRSIRAEHMKWVHKDWKMPPRYVLQRMSRDGVFYNKEPEGDFTCLVDGCPWRGNYRASRSSHMRSQHPEWQPAKKKAPTGGYIEDGKYLCHDTNCGWRGASRSTRAAHMKRAHPGFLNPVCQPRMLLCPDCNVQCCTHKTFVDHLVDHHKIGGSVRREFTGIQDYEEWYEAVQDAFSVEFIKKMGVKQNESYQITYLYCARGGGTTRLKQVKQHPYSSQYVKMKNLARPFRSRNHCAAFLRVLHWTDGKLTVYGCAEHTGHRLGTAILRLSPTERDIMEEFIYVNDDENPMEQMLYKFKEVENYVVEGYPLPLYDEAVLTESMLDKNNERLSLKSLVQTFPAGSTFNVSIPEKIIADGEVFDLSLGIMTDEMKELWKVYGSKVVCFEEVRLIIGNWNLSLIFVLVFAEDNSPRCCCIYLSNVSDRIAVLKHLSEISLQPPQALITDHLQEWPLILESVYGDAAYSVELLTADWHLLAEWADSLDKIVQNRVDRFTIFACLRRWLRVTDPALFDAYIVEMFEAFRELNLDDMTHRIDMALIDPENFKRWNPLSRTTPLTEHHNPIVDIAYRHFREHFLNAESCTRLDQYIGLLMSRIPIFNKCITSEPVAHGIIEPMRQLPISENISSPSATVLADGSIIMHEDNSEELIIESELDENGHPYIVDEKDGIIGSVIQEEIVEEFTEEIGEEEIVDMSDMPSTSGIVYEEQSEYIDPSSNSYELVEEISNDANHARKKRVSILLQTIQKNPSSLTGHHLDLLENSLSQVVDQLDHSAQPQ